MSEESENKSSSIDLEAKRIKSQELKMISQKRIAWVAMLSMVAITAFILSPLISPEKIKAFSEIINIFYISMAGIVGSFMGVTAWIARK